MKTKFLNNIKLYKMGTLMLCSLGIFSIIYDKKKNQYKKRKISNTLVPMSINVHYLLTVLFLLKIYKTFDENEEVKIFSKKVFSLLAASGGITMLCAILVGGGIYKFKICYRIYLVALAAWILELAIASDYYIDGINKLIE